VQQILHVIFVGDLQRRPTSVSVPQLSRYRVKALADALHLRHRWGAFLSRWWRRRKAGETFQASGVLSEQPDLNPDILCSLGRSFLLRWTVVKCCAAEIENSSWRASIHDRADSVVVAPERIGKPVFESDAPSTLIFAGDRARLGEIRSACGQFAK